MLLGGERYCESKQHNDLPRSHTSLFNNHQQLRLLIISFILMTLNVIQG